MKTLLIAITTAALASTVPQSALFAADTPEAKTAEAKEASGSALEEHMKKDILPKIRAKANSGKRAEADYTEELKEIDSLYESHKGEKTKDVAGLLMFKAQIYLQIFNDVPKAIGFLKQVQADFADTDAGKQAGDFIGQIEKQAAMQAEAEKAQAALAVGKVFPDFSETDLNGKPLSIANYKGKVVLIDFWATWCGPCVAELPNVIKAYEKYHDKGFEIIGISLDNAKDKEKLTTFITEKKMPWQQFFDGGGWKNKLAAQYGINSIPATYLLDKEGKVIGKGLRGAALDTAVAAALGLAAPAEVKPDDDKTEK